MPNSEKKKLKVNKIQCLNCKDIIESEFTHDFKWCKCSKVFVDGGKSYLRRGGCLEYIKDLSEYENE